MPTGRKPTPLKLVDNAKARHTKETLDGRQNGEPEGCTDKLTPPKTISSEAKKEWKRIVKLYRQLDAKIINDLDISTLMAYCESVAIYRRAQEEYQNRPLVYMNADGRPAENPYITIMRREGQNIAKYAEQLCLSPVGRARMGVAAAKKEAESDPMAAYLNKYDG
jgi:P27 family predicted phage terminase small subunit